MALLSPRRKAGRGARIALLGGSKPQIYDQPALQGEEPERWLVREVALSSPWSVLPRRALLRDTPARERGRKVVE